jgi:hypothetical protein
MGTVVKRIRGAQKVPRRDYENGPRTSERDLIGRKEDEQTTFSMVNQI